MSENTIQNDPLNTLSSGTVTDSVASTPSDTIPPTASTQLDTTSTAIFAPGLFSFTQTSYQGLEGTGGGAVNQVIATIQRTSGSLGVVTVPVLLSNVPGTATAGVDYTNVFPLSVVFQDGQTSANVVIPIIQNSIPEPDNTINIKLGTPTIASGFPPSLVSPFNATYTILDDDYVAYKNTNSIVIPDSGPANTYPTNISVSGITGTITKVTAELFGFTHTWPSDVDVLVVGPTGQKTVLMSYAGGSSAVSGINLTFDQTAATNLGNGAQLSSGTYRPTDNFSFDPFTPPAPIVPNGTYTSDLSLFNGTNPNGTWQLYVIDSSPHNSGVISGGWQLKFDTPTPVVVPPTPVVVPPTPVVVPPTPVVVPPTPVVVPSISINNVSLSEGNSGTKNATFPVSLSTATTQNISVSYSTANKTATAGTDYASTSGTLSFSPGQTQQSINVPVIGNTIYEPDKTFTVNLNSPINATIANGQGIGTILNDDRLPTVSISDTTVQDGTSGTTNANFTLTLSNQSYQSVTAYYATADNTAKSFSQYAPNGGSGITFAPGQTQQTISIPTYGNTTYQPNKNFLVNLYAADNATLGRSQAVGTIQNGAALPTVSISDTTVQDGTSGTTNANFTLTLSNPSYQSVTAYYATADNTAKSFSQYAPNGGSGITFAPGQTQQTISIPTYGNTTYQPNKNFLVNLYAADNATLGRSQAVGTIQNGAALPTVSISDTTVQDGTSGTTNANFTLTLSNPSYQSVTAYYYTADNTAKSFSQYAPNGGSGITFAPGQTQQTISIPTYGNTTYQPNKNFLVNLYAADNATLGRSQAVGTIQNGAALPTVSISDTTVQDGTSGTTNANFTLTLSNPSYQSVTAYYYTADNTAKSFSQYAPNGGTSITFAPGQTQQTISIPTYGNTTYQPNKNFLVNLYGADNATLGRSQAVGTIQNGAALPTVSISDTTVLEGNSGTSNAAFTLTLSNPSYQSVTAYYYTADNTAKGYSQYTPNGGTSITFAPGQTQQTINIPIFGNTTYEPDRSFLVNLYGADNATVGRNQAVGTIKNDDPYPTLSVNDVTVNGGNSGTREATFTLTLSNPTYQTVSAYYATANNTATAGSDYAQTSGSLVFNPGQTQKSVTVLVQGSTKTKPTETFTFNVTNVANASINKSQGIGTIKNDASFSSTSTSTDPLTTGFITPTLT